MVDMIGPAIGTNTPKEPVPLLPKVDESFVDRAWEKGIQKLQPYHRQWYINFAFLMGFQWLVWHPQRNRLWLPPGKRRRIRMTSNLIMSAYRINLAKLVSLETQIGVLPNSGEQEDVDAARLGKHLWDHIKHTIGWKSIKRAVGSWALTTGNGFVEFFWDQNSGERLSVPSPQIQAEDQGEESPGETSPEEGPRHEAREEVMHAGRVHARVVSPFQVVPVGMGSYVDDLPAIIVGDWMPLSRIKSIYGEAAKGVEGMDRKRGSTFEEALESLVSPSTGSSSNLSGDEDEEKGALVLRYYERDCGKYPQGRLIIRANRHTLYSGPNPTPQDHWGRIPLPIIQYKDIDLPHRFWGQAFIQDMIPDQKAYNKCESDILEHLSIYRGKWRVPRGAKLKETALDNSPDEVIEYTPVAGLRPEHVPLQPPQQSAFILMQHHRKNMEDQSGVREVSRGINPAGARSALAIQQLQEADNTQIAITSQQFGDADAKAAGLALMLAEKNMIFPMKLRVFGRNAAVDVIHESFTGDMLRGNTQVIAAGPTVPFSLIAKKAEILQYVQMGLIGIDPDTGQLDARLVLELLGFGQVEDVFSKQSLEETRILEENRLLFKIQDIPTARPYQNHQMHIDLHNRKRLSPEYQRAIDDRPEIEVAFEDHIRQHATFLQQQMMAIQGGPEPVPMPKAPAPSGPESNGASPNTPPLFSMAQ